MSTDGQGQEPILLEVTNLKKHFPIQQGFFRQRRRPRARRGRRELFHPEGETLGLVGESGCGKTTTGRFILRDLEPTDGRDSLPAETGRWSTSPRFRQEELKAFRREMQIIFQDPFSSLNPRMTVMDIIGEPLVIHGIAKGDELRAQVRELLEMVGLRAQHMNRYPYAFSGGQRQRIGIARALALRPKLIVCDEPVSALDVSIQAQVLNLLEDLQDEFGLTYLFIAHDLSVVEHISDRVAVMYLGKIVELATAEELSIRARCIPTPRRCSRPCPAPIPTTRPERIILPGDVPSPANPPSGCKFHPRCRYVKADCADAEPPLRELEAGHFVACHYAEELELRRAD